VTAVRERFGGEDSRIWQQEEREGYIGGGRELLVWRHHSSRKEFGWPG